ncbi:uncharacterized protein ColSpa_03699 [Colletotrichum spaethianum]|uniref:Uncharacterized protein n=1 Tax=Colletotrichum spaethianum TaxID=700344 RepID=A0AA37LC03_9PEZI|nr:uncharacterized protein ColSpa_03699 [Colletotrichum spaethianum]GKT43518.1 hypothetical protein ColSpa_03699 [Colletotrichum spaethianum]
MAALPAFGNYHLVELAEALDSALDQRLGRHLTPTPAHLSRVVYIPNHKDITTHLPLYDITENYVKAVKTEFIGSTMMKKPNGDGIDAEVRYLVDFASDFAETVVTIERRVPGHDGEMVSMHLPLEANGGFRVASLDPMQVMQLVVANSFPVPDTKMHAGATPVRHPWFQISHSSRDGAASVPSNLEWQIRPTELGPLRYTLVDTAVNTENGEPMIHAIYHHIGIGFGLPNDYSEGVLLLSENLNGEAETLAVATLLGLLRQVRSVNQPPPKSRKKSLVKRVLGKI